jgi:excinuclease ABC subunit C
MRVRDEAHRFAVTYHKKLRSKEIEGSALDNIPGVGSKRKLKLIRHFGSMENIQKASPEEIAEVDGISQKLAQTIHRELQNVSK